MKVALLVILVVVIGSALWQHFRYLRERRDAAQDFQPLLYGPNAFHLIVHVRTEHDSDDAVLAALRKVKSETEAELLWVYAGRVAANGEHSTQMGDIEWTACVLLQAPSREQADEAISGRLGAALAEFPDVHIQGFDRPVFSNLLFPQIQGLRRLSAVVRRQPPHLPFTRHEGEMAMPQAPELASQITRGESLNKRGAVVFNLSGLGTPEQQASDAAYTEQILGSMAEGGYGPIHWGRAVRVSGQAEFERVAIVYYPGVRFFGDMIQSSFFQSIVPGKQLGDNQSTITVPVLDRL